MPSLARARKPEGLDVFEGFLGSMAPQLVPSDVSWLNLIDIDCSHYLSSKTDRGYHDRPRPSLKSRKILRFQRIFDFHGSKIVFLT
jgi:hypothetical protein